MHELYTSGRRKNGKVVTVFVGGSDVPSHAMCCAALTMDPEVAPPVLVIPFGGLPFAGVDDDDAVALMMISQLTPNLMDNAFSYRCTHLRDILLIKVLVQRDSCTRLELVESVTDIMDHVSPN